MKTVDVAIIGAGSAVGEADFARQGRALIMAENEGRADEPLVGGLAPRLGSGHLRTLTIMGSRAATYPGFSTNSTGSPG